MTKEKNNIKKRWLLQVAVVCILSVVAIGFLFVAYESNSAHTQSYKESEIIINKFIAKQLNKDPNELTQEDFNRLNTLSIHGLEIKTIKPLTKLKNLNVLGLSLLQVSDIKPLAKLGNLKTLQLSNVKLRDRERPKWLTKLRVILRLPTGSISETKSVDLSPLKKLKNLEFLDIRNTNFYNIGILSELHKLQHLAISRRNSPDMGRIQSQKTSSLDLKPLKGLIKLNYLDLFGMPVNNITPLKELINLKEIHLENCEGITDQHIEDLQKALPELKIKR